jgi:hypothetical protein
MRYQTQSSLLRSAWFAGTCEHGCALTTVDGVGKCDAVPQPICSSLPQYGMRDNVRERITGDGGALRDPMPRDAATRFLPNRYGQAPLVVLEKQKILSSGVAQLVRSPSAEPERESRLRFRDKGCLVFRWTWVPYGAGPIAAIAPPRFQRAGGRFCREPLGREGVCRSRRAFFV